MSLVRSVAVAAVCLIGLLSVSTASPAAPAATDGEVTGSITLQEKPLADGRIFFHLAHGQFVGCKVKAGKYRIERVPVGTRIVTIEGDGVPLKYKFEDKSALVTEIRSGANAINLDLQD